MTPAELRALPIVIYERRHHHQRDRAFDNLLVRPLVDHCACAGNVAQLSLRRPCLST